MGELHIMVGPPGSGKSTAADALRKLRVVDTIIRPDDIRAKLIARKGGPDPYYDVTLEPVVWNEVYKKIARGLRQDKRVLLDSTNLTSNDRTKAKKAATRYKATAIAHIMVIPFEEAYKRNLERKRVVPHDAMMRMRSNFRSQCAFSQIEADGFEIRLYDCA